jgi:hypothetical protein
MSNDVTSSSHGLSTAAASRSREEWHPPETAPKDREIQIAYRSATGVRVTAGRWKTLISLRPGAFACSIIAIRIDDKDFLAWAEMAGSPPTSRLQPAAASDMVATPSAHGASANRSAIVGHTKTPWKFHAKHPIQYKSGDLIVDRDAPPVSYIVNSTFHDDVDDCKTTMQIANVVVTDGNVSQAQANAALIVAAVNAYTTTPSDDLVTVPREPTNEMMLAWRSGYYAQGNNRNPLLPAYAAMLAAAPTTTPQALSEQPCCEAVTMDIVERLNDVAVSIGLPWDAAYRQNVFDTVKEARAEILRLRQQAGDGRQLYRCDGCGREAFDPVADLNAIKADGKISCCPERKMQPVQAGDGEAKPVKCADCGGPESDHQSNYYCPEFRASPPSPAVPENWKLVPVEPTEEMMEAGLAQWSNLRDMYEAMLSASPASTKDSPND